MDRREEKEDLLSRENSESSSAPILNITTESGRLPEKPCFLFPLQTIVSYNIIESKIDRERACTRAGKIRRHVYSRTWYDLLSGTP
jgi:hypothetical protein